MQLIRVTLVSYTIRFQQIFAKKTRPYKIFYNNPSICYITTLLALGVISLSVLGLISQLGMITDQCQNEIRCLDSTNTPGILMNHSPVYRGPSNKSLLSYDIQFKELTTFYYRDVDVCDTENSTVTLRQIYGQNKRSDTETSHERDRK